MKSWRLLSGAPRERASVKRLKNGGAQRNAGARLRLLGFKHYCDRRKNGKRVGGFRAISKPCGQPLNRSQVDCKRIPTSLIGSHGLSLMPVLSIRSSSRLAV